MLKTFFSKLKDALKDETLRKRILFILMILALFRALAAVPIPGINTAQLANFLQGNQFLGLLNIFSGGGLVGLSIVMLGVGPFITASIVMQLLTVISRKLKAMYQEEGEAGRARFIQYSRMLTVPLALLQSYGFLTLLTKNGIVGQISSFDFMVNVLLITAGSMLLMWLGELVTEYGIGNGVSIIIFAGIVASLPTAVLNAIVNYDPTQLPNYVALILLSLLVTALVVFVTEAERPIPITYARQSRLGQKSNQVSTYLPIRVNQAGVMPIIFAISIMLFPQMVAQYLSVANVGWAADLANKMNAFLNNTYFYAPTYFFLVVIFTYFYTAITFEPKQVAENLQKSGAFIPGIRPGIETMEFLANTVTRITLVGALFLGAVAVLPVIVQAYSGLNSFAVGGTALLIAVSVVLDVIKKVEAQLSVREY